MPSTDQVYLAQPVLVARKVGKARLDLGAVLERPRRCPSQVAKAEVLLPGEQLHTERGVAVGLGRVALHGNAFDQRCAGVGLEHGGEQALAADHMGLAEVFAVGATLARCGGDRGAGQEAGAFLAWQGARPVLAWAIRVVGRAHDGRLGRAGGALPAIIRDELPRLACDPPGGGQDIGVHGAAPLLAGQDVVFLARRLAVEPTGFKLVKGTRLDAGGELVVRQGVEVIGMVAAAALGGERNPRSKPWAGRCRGRRWCPA